jgi:hypothetical protein
MGTEKERAVIEAFAKEDETTLKGVVELILQAIDLKVDRSNYFAVINHQFLHGPITDMQDVWSVALLEEMEREGWLWCLEDHGIRYYSFTDHGLSEYIHGDHDYEFC